MYDTADLAWAGGFFDGEGCFSRTATAVATMAQTHLECLDVFLNVVDVGTIKGPYEKSTIAMTRKPQWIYYAYGKDARQVYDVLSPWLSDYRRRTSKATGVSGFLECEHRFTYNRVHRAVS